MKKLNILFAALAMMLVGCKEKDNWTPGLEVSPNAQTLFFEVCDETGIECDPADPITEWPVVVSRTDAKLNECQVALQVLENTDEVYTVPAMVAFAEGETEALVTIQVGQMKPGQLYKLRMMLSMEAINPYTELSEVCAGSSVVYEMSINPIPWSEVRQGVIEDGLIDDWFGTGMWAFYADYQIAEMPDGSTKIRILNAYNRPCMAEEPDELGIWEAYPYMAPGDELEGDYVISLEIDEDGNAFMPLAELGFDWGYGSFWVKTASAYGYWNGKVAYFAGDDGALATCMVDYSPSFYVCAKDWSFFVSAEEYIHFYEEMGEMEAPARKVMGTRTLRTR